jgi:hypothetical protein
MPPSAAPTDRHWLDTPSLIRFLEDQQAAGRMARPWSDSVKQRVAQHVLRQMTDLGLAGPNRRGSRELLPFAPSNLAVAWLAYELHCQGCSDAAVTAHRDWQLWILHEPNLRERLALLARRELWEIQAAGSVVQITWACTTWEEAVDVLARIDLR